jgi:hypothetical protein
MLWSHQRNATLSSHRHFEVHIRLQLLSFFATRMEDIHSAARGDTWVIDYHGEESW